MLRPQGLGPQGSDQGARGEEEYHPRHALRLLLARDDARRDGDPQGLPGHLRLRRSNFDLAMKKLQGGVTYSDDTLWRG